MDGMLLKCAIRQALVGALAGTIQTGNFVLPATLADLKMHRHSKHAMKLPVQNLN